MDTNLEQLSQLILEQSSHMYCVFDHNSQLIFCSNSLLISLGVESLDTPTFTELVHLDDREMVRKKYFLCKDNHRLTTAELRIKDSNGLTKWFQTNWAPFKNANGEIIGTLVSMVDISAKKHFDEEVEKSEDNFLSLFDSNIVGMTLSDLTGNIFVANDALLNMLGYTRGEFNAGAVNWTKLTPPEYAILDDQVNRQITNNEEVTPFEKEYIRKDGSRVPVLVGLVKLRGDTDKTICLIVDLTQQKYLENQLQYQAMHDFLTGLPNRRHFLNKLSQTLKNPFFREDSGNALMFIDIDDFKEINDSYGHLAGDQALVILAEKLNQHIRKGDIVARLGGDEFVILFENINKEEIIAVADRIYQELSTPQLICGDLIRIGISVGITHGIESTADADTLLKQADQAMYQAKMNGKGKYYLL